MTRVKCHQLETHTTLDELKFLERLGKHRDSRPMLKNVEMNRKELLRGYLMSAVRRKEWGAVDENVIIAYVRNEITKEGAR
jgi:hypothetical protein